MQAEVIYAATEQKFEELINAWLQGCFLALSQDQEATFSIWSNNKD